jgi:hypothetical protein
VGLANWIVALVVVVFSTTPVVAASKEARSAAKLEVALVQLSPAVSKKEARQLSQEAHAVSRQLREEYRVVGPAVLHNFLVNTNVRQRGRCHEWAEDLFAALHAKKFRSMDLHWGHAWKDSLLEHNAVVVTARRQPFEQGLVLDPWRYAGRLVWRPVTNDSFPWRAGRKPALQPVGKTGN